MWRSIHRWIVYPIVAVVVMLLAAIPATISASREASTPLNQFAITSFDADYVLQPQADGTTDVLVTEKIIANFENSGVNRGILRAIPLRYQGHRNTVTEIKVTGEVSLHGRTYGSDQTSSGEQPFSSSEENNVLLIRIGDPNRRLAMGRQEWTLSYRLGDVAMNSPDRTKQEIYLDANGTGWVVPFGKVTARLHVPAKLAGRLDGTSACYWGPEGATNRCPISYAESGAETVFTAEAGPLNKRESMTFAVGFTPETFPVAYTPRAELPPWWLFVVPLLGLLIYLPNLVRYVRARHVGRPRVVVTEYLPPRGVPALAAADIIGRPAKGPTAQLLEFIVAGDITLRTDQSAPTRPDGPPKPLSFWEKRKLRRSLRLSSADISAIEDEDLRVLIQGWFGDWGLGQRPDRLTAAEMAARQHNHDRPARLAGMGPRAVRRVLSALSRIARDRCGDDDRHCSENPGVLGADRCGRPRRAAVDRRRPSQARIRAADRGGPEGTRPPDRAQTVHLHGGGGPNQLAPRSRQRPTGERR